MAAPDKKEKIEQEQGCEHLGDGSGLVKLSINEENKVETKVRTDAAYRNISRQGGRWHE